MAVEYKLCQVNIDGEKKGYYYARALHKSTIKTNQIAELIQRNCTVKRSDILAVLSELAEVMHDQLLDSKTVSLDGIGYFSLNLNGVSAKDPRKVGYDTIKSAYVNFQPFYGKVGTRIETRADGSQVKHIELGNMLTSGVEYVPSDSVQTVIKAYEDANNIIGG